MPFFQTNSLVQEDTPLPWREGIKGRGMKISRENRERGRTAQAQVEGLIIQVLSIMMPYKKGNI